MKSNTNIDMIEVVAQGLGELVQQVAFVGGSIAGVYIDDTAASEVRPTDDVDCIIEIGHRADYYQLEEVLRKKKFTHSFEKRAPICRWKYLGVTVDIMPTDESILGFSNRWYSKGLVKPQKVQLPSGLSIQILAAPFFLATKIEAYLGRGQGDMRTSPDFEDIIVLLNGRSTIEQEIGASPVELKQYLSRNFTSFTQSLSDIEEAIYCHLSQEPGMVERVKSLIDLMIRISGRKK